MVEPIGDLGDLRRHLQWAIEVEHSTIPPYEYAMWSVVDHASAAATSILYVVREEMLHTALAANILTAVGGSPRFTGDAVPRYPQPMPHHDPERPLVLHLAPASVRLIRDVFLRIEQPVEGPDEDTWRMLTTPWRAERPKEVMRAPGCLECRMTGYFGRPLRDARAVLRGDRRRPRAAR